MPTLYLVPTPIGNLEDVTLRALRVLKEVRLIAAEDTRTTLTLLRRYNITTPLTSYHEYNKMDKLDEIFDTLAAEGDVALVSDAGTPGISDPGYELVQAAIQSGYRVEPLPGANAIVTALAGSGLPTDSFIYVGFMPKKKHARVTFLRDMALETRTIVAYESPHRLIETLEDIADVMGERPMCVARELTKKYEEFVRGKASHVLNHFEVNEPRGEITLIIGGATGAEGGWDAGQVREALYALLDSGEALSAAAKTVAGESGWKKKDVYALGVERR